MWFLSVGSLEKIPFSQFSTALDKAMGKQGSSEKQLLVFD